MAKRRWRRRGVIIGAMIVALSIGIVFASLSYLQHPNNSPHGSIQSSITHTVRPGNQSYPGLFDVRIANITLSENFYVGVNVIGGSASFCAIQYQPYFSWKLSYNLTRSPGNSFPAGDCVVQTQQVSQYTLQFAVSPGDWAIVALNTSPSTITVSFFPA